MDELVQLVAQKAGISEDQAQMAVDTVIDYLKNKLPGGQIDGFISSEDAGSSVAEISKGLGGLFDK